MNTANPTGLLEETPAQKPEFKSSFKSWIRVVAFIVVAVFLPEQAAQAAQAAQATPAAQGAPDAIAAQNGAAAAAQTDRKV